MPTKFKRINLTCPPAFIMRLERFMVEHHVSSYAGAIMMLVQQKLTELDAE